MKLSMRVTFYTANMLYQIEKLHVGNTFHLHNYRLRFHRWISLTHWGRVTHMCVHKLIIIGSDNGLSPGRRQAIIWTNAGILLIWPLGTNFNEILIEIHTFSFKKMHLKMSSEKRQSFCLSLNVLTKSIGEQPWIQKSVISIDQCAGFMSDPHRGCRFYFN